MRAQVGKAILSGNVLFKNVVLGRTAQSLNGDATLFRDIDEQYLITDRGTDPADAATHLAGADDADGLDAVECHNYLGIEVCGPGPHVVCLSVPVTDSLSPPVPCLLPDSWSFYDNRQRFSTSDTEAGQPSSGAAGLHGIEQGRENPRAGGADRMAQRDRPTVDVDSLWVEP